MLVQLTLDPSPRLLTWASVSQTPGFPALVFTSLQRGRSPAFCPGPSSKLTHTYTHLPELRVAPGADGRCFSAESRSSAKVIFHSWVFSSREGLINGSQNFVSCQWRTGQNPGAEQFASERLTSFSPNTANTSSLGPVAAPGFSLARLPPLMRFSLCV